MRLFSYVVVRDYGFAPNPFYGACTLATCKPRIRRTAAVGDWVIGTGSKGRGREGSLVYVMCVSQTMTFDEYWTDPRFLRKRPNLKGSVKQAYGDNIYFKDENDLWQQQDSHHSRTGGIPNCRNVRHDTSVDRILVGDEYVYWGGEGPKISQKFRDYDGKDICKAGPGHKCDFTTNLIKEFIQWVCSRDEHGCRGKPLDWL